MTRVSVLVTSGVVTLVVLIGQRHRPRPLRVHELASRPRSLRIRPRILAHWKSPSLALGLATTAILGGPVLTAVVITIALLQPRLAASRCRRRFAVSVVSAYPDFVDLLVLTVRAGCTPVQGFHILAAAVDQPFRAAVIDVDRRVAAGARFADAVQQLPLGLGAVVQPLTDGLALADRHGTPLAPMLDRLADDARAQRRRNADAAARQLPIRLSFPLVGCTLPSFVLLTIVPLMAGTLSSFRGLRP